ncbi:MAG: o-succinylbenzoate--CoA ligase [Pseudanabaena sp. 42896M_M3]|jgi:O-succinylbenzoic acid--CoA ligase|nr:o-succinylbenzoate--CoA ligase [Pseudanabaena sp. 42896M_M3]
MKFPNWLSQRAIQKKSAIALIFRSPFDQEVERWTYAELEAEVNHWVECLQTLGIKFGDRIGLLLTNHPRYIILVHALVKCEAIAVFLNIRLTTEELRWQIEDSQAKYLLCDELTKSTVNNLDKQIDHLIISEISSFSLLNFQLNGCKHCSENIDLENTQGIFYTSGTTGKPKAVPLTYNNHFHSAISSALNLGIEPNDNWLLCMPLFHVGGLSIAWRSVVNGTKITLLPKFDEQEVLDAIATEKVTIISLVPTMLSRLLAHPQWQNLQKLRAILLGGAPASPELIEQCLQLNLPISPTYGMTETASQITTLPSHEVAKKRGSSGLPLFGNRLRIVDDQQQDLDVGEIGQILIQGASVMNGYLNQLDKNIQDGWLHTGDLGYLDRDGYLYVISRRSDLIISGGENIYPTEIEAILLEHPAIVEACVVGIGDREWGEIVTAAIVTDIQLSLEEIRNFCEQKSLARYKLPKSIYIWESLPKTASGKLLRQKIRDRLESV